VSIQDIQQNPQDTSNFYLAGIYQNVINPNRSDILSSLPASPPPFSPPTYAIWVNSLWFLSLVISITCALLATLLQQWVRRYLKVTQTRSSLHKRARIRSFFAEGVKNSILPWVVEALPTLIHVSLFLFFAGLVVFLWNVNLTIFKVVLSWISVCTALYGCITLAPIFLRNSPCYSPLTPLVRPVLFVIVLVFALLYFCFYAFLLSFSFCYRCRGSIRTSGHLLGWFIEVLGIIRMTPEETAMKSSSGVDIRAFTWTFDSLDEDHELERFFSGLPGFHNSRVLKEPLHGLDGRQKLRLLEAVIRLLDRTFTSNLLPDQVKRRRADICDNAMKLVDTPDAFPNIVRRLVSEGKYGPVQSTEILAVVKRWGSRKGKCSAMVQAIFSIVVARVQQHDNSWFTLASDQLGIPETVLRSYATHGDNLSLVILIYVTRQQFIYIQNRAWPSYTIASVLSAASKFNVQDTSPELQHEFCALWNELISKMQNDNRMIPERILRPIRHVYIQLHQGTNSAPTLFSASTRDTNNVLDDPDLYPMCNVTGHVHDGSASMIFPHPVLNDDPATSTVSPTSLGAPSLHASAPFPVDESLTTPPTLENSHLTPQTVDNRQVPVTSPDPVTAGVMRDIVAAGVTTPLPTPETSFSTSLSSASEPPEVSPRHNANRLASSDPPNPSSSASNTVLDNIHHTGALLTSHLPMTRSDISPSCRLIAATAAPSTSQGITSVTDLDATPEEYGSPMPTLRDAEDTLYPPALNRTPMRTTALNAVDSQSPSLPSFPDSDRAI
jgi:hypothetical protein